MDLKVRWQADRIGLAVLLASGIAARLYLIHWHAHIIPDDAYYYLEISRNLAMGRGFTFDGLAPTNGFHPLWCLILSPMWFVPIPQPIAPIKLILAASSILYIAAAWPLFRLTFDLTRDRWASLLITCIFLVNPGGIILSLSGMETSLALFLAACFALQVLRLREQTTWKAWSWIALGATGGAMMLARSDTALLVVSSLILQIDQIPLAPKRRGWMLALLIMALALLPWLLWSLLALGTPIQVSGLAKPLFFHRIFLADHGTFFTPGLLARIGENVRDFLLWSLAYSGLHAPTAFFILGATGGLLLAGGHGQAIHLWRMIRRVDFLLLFSFVFLLFHAGWRWDFRGYYMSFFLLALYPTLGILLAWARRASQWGSSRWPQSVLAIGLLLVFLSSAPRLYRDELTAAGNHRFNISETMNALARAKRMFPERVNPLEHFVRLLRGEEDLTPNLLAYLSSVPAIEGSPEALHSAPRVPRLVGFTDCGRLGYFGHFSGSIRVVNLDGAVNNWAYQALKRGRLLDYIRERGLDEVWLPPAYQREIFLGPDFRTVLQPIPGAPRRFIVRARGMSHSSRHGALSWNRG